MDEKCTFETYGHLRATLNGKVTLRAKDQVNGTMVEVQVKDAMWVSGLPCQLLGTKSIRW